MNLPPTSFASHSQFAHEQIAVLSQQIASLGEIIRHYEGIVAATATPAEQPVRRRRAHGEFRAALLRALDHVGKVGATVDDLKTVVEQRLAGPVNRNQVGVTLRSLEAQGRARRSGKLWAAAA